MKNLRVELTARRQTLVDLKMHRGIFSQLQFIVGMMPLNYLLEREGG